MEVAIEVQKVKYEGMYEEQKQRYADYVKLESEKKNEDEGKR